MESLQNNPCVIEKWVSLSHYNFPCVEQEAIGLEPESVHARRQVPPFQLQLVAGSFLLAHQASTHIEHCQCQSFKSALVFFNFKHNRRCKRIGISTYIHPRHIGLPDPSDQLD